MDRRVRCASEFLCHCRFAECSLSLLQGCRSHRPTLRARDASFRCSDRKVGRERICGWARSPVLAEMAVAGEDGRRRSGPRTRGSEVDAQPQAYRAPRPAADEVNAVPEIEV